jgi:hypothetical protein
MMMNVRTLCRALAGIVLLGAVAPAAAQQEPAESGQRVIADVPAPQREEPALHPALFPSPCLACVADPSMRAAPGPTLDPARLPRGVAPVIGGVVGAVAGLVVVRLYCADRFCEMGDLVGPLVGAVVGVMIGQSYEGSLSGREW